MSTLVFGGSSQIGRFLLPQLVAQGDQVVAVSRIRQAPQPGVRWIVGALPDAVATMPQAVSAIVCFGPLLPFARWLAAAAPGGAPRVVATSSMSAQSKQDSLVPAERAVARQLRDGEAELARACAGIGCDWTVLRPTLIYGAGLDKSLTPIARRAMRLRVFPLPAGCGLRQPVHAQDIASAVLAALQRPAAAGRVLALGGGERLPAQEMFSRVRQSLPVSTVAVPVPRWVLSLGRRVAPRLRGPLDRLEVDLIADNHEIEDVLGVSPRPFRPDAACWLPPV